MNVASLELCKELYELSKWRGTYFVYDLKGNVVPPNGESQNYQCSAYDCGYLLRKLPQFIVHDNFECRLEVCPSGFKERNNDSSWCASYSDIKTFHIPYLGNADTPENALASLAVELFKQGVLKS